MNGEWNVIYTVECYSALKKMKFKVNNKSRKDYNSQMLWFMTLIPALGKQRSLSWSQPDVQIQFQGSSGYTKETLSWKT